MASVLLRAGMAVALAAAPAATQRFAVEVSPDVAGRIDGCPERTGPAYSTLFEQRLQAMGAAMGRDVRPLLDGCDRRVQLVLAPRDPDTRARIAELCGVDLDGRGVLAVDGTAVVLAPASADLRDAELWRAADHAAALLVLADVVPAGSSGLDWLAVGLAHRAEHLATGSIDACVVDGVVLGPHPVWGGDWFRAAGELLRRDQLPAIDALCRTEASDLDLGQRVLAFVLVEWLLEGAGAGAPTTHADGDAATPPSRIAQIVGAVRDGATAAAALQRVTGHAPEELERRVHTFVTERAGKLGASRPDPVRHHRPHPHARVFVYTGQPVLQRHRAVVTAALKQRHAAHTSGWRIDDGAPELAIGPVNRAAGFWHGDDLVKTIERTWPMVAVLEYDPRGAPAAQLHCFRRVRARRGDDGWMLDPSVGFVPHHNAQFVTARDDRLAYLAVPDTPTGGHVAGSAFVHRGQVRWADGSFATVGVWTELHAPKTRTTERWHAVRTPLVDWTVTDGSRALGAQRFEAVEDAERELSPWGTARVLRFPAVPTGLFVARGN